MSVSFLTSSNDSPSCASFTFCGFIYLSVTPRLLPPRAVGLLQLNTGCQGLFRTRLVLPVGAAGWRCCHSHSSPFLPAASPPASWQHRQDDFGRGGDSSSCDAILVCAKGSSSWFWNRLVILGVLIAIFWTSITCQIQSLQIFSSILWITF